MMQTDLIARYRAAAHDDDPAVRAVARRQLVRLIHVPTPAATDERPAYPPSRWVHVPLADLFAAQGNRLYMRGDRIETGHEPLHSSKSGRCVWIDPTAGRWWCRSCRRRGDAITYIQELHGSTYTGAAQWLTERYGPPAGESRRTPRRPPQPRWIEVAL
ncbi:MAG: hypothetical protein HY331_03150 [Chloroflexi bacterium]|nr:hypothetical protein [Chloroflexota bacterium]